MVVKRLAMACAAGRPRARTLHQKRSAVARKLACCATCTPSRAGAAPELPKADGIGRGGCGEAREEPRREIPGGTPRRRLRSGREVMRVRIEREEREGRGNCPFHAWLKGASSC